MVFLIALYALAAGSFLSVCIYRLPVKEALVFTLSRCTGCNAKIKPFDLIPVVSFILLNGKCRSCKSPIPVRYLFVELISCFLIVLLYLCYGLSWLFLFYGVVTCVLIVAAFIDIDKMIVPNGLVVFLLLAGIVNVVVGVLYGSGIGVVVDYLLAFAAGGGLFYIIALVTRGKMGGGDIKLIAALGFCLGLRFLLLTVFLSFLLGAVIGIVLIMAKVISNNKPIPFVPFILMGGVLTLLYGDKIIGFYLSIIF